MAETEQQGTRVGPAAEASESESETPRVTAHTTTPDRVVFVENGNEDGWIATDLAVDCWQ